MTRYRKLMARRAFLIKASAMPIALIIPPVTRGASTSAAVSSPRVFDQGYTVDPSIVSPNQEPRIHTLVLHYTATSLAHALDILTDPARGVSAHYLVPDAAGPDGRFLVFALVPEARLAHHAGVSYWLGERLVNGTSIGIEIVNLGYGDGYDKGEDDLPLMKRDWHPYLAEQIAVVGRLAADIVARHGIAPTHVVGHADVAPGRKVDPGPYFPWRRLYEDYGVGAWPDEATVEYYRHNAPYHDDIGELQAKLLAYGYDAPQSGELDARTVSVISSFQMHFCPARYDGVPDVDTVAVLDALLEKYFGAKRPPCRTA
ncbi:N-acetylmuramoyl-L-alanine amidase [Pandoraea sp. NPDC090278]|uniref:N-acetylmuramoyl-L-alanine amidase n=1 Tax=Pandoraea sp. NPDC090278 TaxID=3364391 RepID=UPI00383B24B6